jgi:UDP-N-acetylmuramyl tripeptide synthase
MSVVGVDVVEVDSIIAACERAAKVSTRSFEAWAGSASWLILYGHKPDAVAKWIAEVSKNG